MSAPSDSSSCVGAVSTKFPQQHGHCSVHLARVGLGSHLVRDGKSVDRYADMLAACSLQLAANLAGVRDDRTRCPHLHFRTLIIISLLAIPEGTQIEHFVNK